ncbi:MAG: cysteine desulfurase-like protein [Pirellulaceae bacterium]|nr:cysteine desulfurase-like protein [Pirellulaceae bacterium]
MRFLWQLGNIVSLNNPFIANQFGYSNMTSFASIVPQLRQQFPSLSRVAPDSNRSIAYLDAPAGSQVPQSVINAVTDYYRWHNANTGGAFGTSRQTAALTAEAHQAAADWFGCTDAGECIFGANMTTMTLAFSRALARTWKPGQRIVVTQLDHDANVTSWKLAARDVGVEVDTISVNVADATLDEQDFQRKVTDQTRLVALTAASNSVGSTTRVQQLTELAHRAGAEVYLDAVHWAPHRLIDVAQWGVDYCICSAYKFFGPHVGLLWGRRQRLEELAAYKLRPSPNSLPGKWMTGTPNFAAIAGVRAAIDYLANIGYQLSSASQDSYRHQTVEELPNDNPLDMSPASPTPNRRQALQIALTAIQEYETGLATQLIDGLLGLPKVTVYGITDPQRFAERVPTVVFTVEGLTSQQVASYLDSRGIYCWHGDYYAVDICAALGQARDGMVRLGIVHTTTTEEIQRVIDELQRLVS